MGILGICHSLLLSILTQSHQIELLTTSHTFPPYSLDLRCSSAHSTQTGHINSTFGSFPAPFPHPQHFWWVPLSLCQVWKTLIVPFSHLSVEHLSFHSQKGLPELPHFATAIQNTSVTYVFKLKSAINISTSCSPLQILGHKIKCSGFT